MLTIIIEKKTIMIFFHKDPCFYQIGIFCANKKASHRVSNCHRKTRVLSHTRRIPAISGGGRCSSCSAEFCSRVSLIMSAVYACVDFSLSLLWGPGAERPTLVQPATSQRPQLIKSVFKNKPPFLFAAPRGSSIAHFAH